MPSRLNPRQIEAFRAVVLTGSMTAAAVMLHISQPAISRLVRDLECGTALTLGFLPEVIGRFLAERDGVTVNLRTANTRNVHELVAMRHFDIGLATLTGEYPGVELEPLPPQFAVCIVPVNHRLANAPIVRAEDLDGERFISLDQPSVLRHRVDAALHGAKVECQTVIETPLSLTMCRLVGQGLGVAIVNPFISYHAFTDIVTKPFEPKIPWQLSLVYPARRHKGSLTEAFAAIVRDALGE